MADDPILRMPGEWLAEAREAAGLTLAEVAERTKVPIRMLQSIERDEYHKLSGPLYVKSFLRAYAVEVGLEVEEILDLYARMTGTTTDGGQAAVPEEERVTISRVGLPWWRILAMGLVGAAVVVSVALSMRGCREDTAGQRPLADETPKPAVTLEEEGAVAAVGDPLPATPADIPAAAGADADSLAGGWLAEEPREDPIQPVVPPTRETVETPIVEDAAPVVVTREQPTGLPVAIAGSGSMPFAGGRRWPVVMRLICIEPVEAQVRADGDAVFSTVDFGSGAPSALPAGGPVPGRAYAVQEGFAVYWGAEDHFGLKLSRTVGVNVTINGRAADVSRLRPGQEKILDALR